MGWREARRLRPPGPAPRPRERKVCENSPELASNSPRDGDTGDWSLGDIELDPLAGRCSAEESLTGSAARRPAQPRAGPAGRALWRPKPSFSTGEPGWFAPNAGTGRAA